MATSDKVLIIVEGYGEVEAAPLLARRVAFELLNTYTATFIQQRRRGLCHLRSQNWHHFRRYLKAAFYENCPILWMLDVDDDCAVDVAIEMSNVANEENCPVPFAVNLWVREFETMFLYDLETLSKKLDRFDLDGATNQPETIRGVKEWISSRMPKGSIYKPSVDQARISGSIDVSKVFNTYRSFQHFVKTLEWLLLTR